MIASYNLLAEVNTVGKESANPEIFHDWVYRAKRVIRELDEQDYDDKPNIIFLQEVDHYTDFYKSELLRIGYDSEIAME